MSLPTLPQLGLIQHDKDWGGGGGAWSVYPVVLMRGLSCSSSLLLIIRRPDVTVSGEDVTVVSIIGVILTFWEKEKFCDEPAMLID